MKVFTAAEATVETLLRHGVDTVYGIPGYHNDPLFDAFYKAQDRLRVIHTRHEQGAAYMALGAALTTGKPQVFSVVPGPGFLNASAALLTAYGQNAPVVALVGQIPQVEIDRGHGYLHEIRDQLGMAQHVVKDVWRIRSAQEAPAVVSRAIQVARSGRPGPVVIECAMDVWGRSSEVEILESPLPIIHSPVDFGAVERAAQLLAASKRPLILVGGGARGASSEVTALAEMLEAPVMAYQQGLGVVDSTHRLSVNLPVGHRLWRDADVVLGIGTRMFFPLRHWGLDKGMKMIRIDVDPEEMERTRKPEVAMLGDAADYCRALLKHFPSETRESREGELQSHRAWLYDRLTRLEPQVSFLKAIRAALPEDGVFVPDVTQIGFASRLAFPVARPGTYFSPGYQDNLGWAFGTALGLKAARPELPVLCVTGDGGFMYQVGELATAVRHKINLVTVVFDNGIYENVQRIQEENYGGRVIATDLANPDFCRMAEAFGVVAMTARTPLALKERITEAFALDRPVLIHVPCEPMPSPWDMILMPRIRG